MIKQPTNDLPQPKADPPKSRAKAKRRPKVEPVRLAGGCLLYRIGDYLPDPWGEWAGW